MDKQTILNAQSGDISAFEQIYSQNSSFVWKTIYRMLNNEDESKDIMQEVFVRVYQKLNTYRFESKFSTWVYKVAVTTTLNYIQKKTRQSFLQQQFQKEVFNFQYISESELEGVGDEDIVNILLEKLNPIQRACVILKDLDGYSYEDISNILEQNIGTVKSNLNRARHILRKSWVKKGGQYHVMSVY